MSGLFETCWLMLISANDQIAPAEMACTERDHELAIATGMVNVDEIPKDGCTIKTDA